ncbi:MAG TPA: Tn3 family transposase [Terrimicrobiaceae bacterium]|nr:Tn3 family transposase [Terrimicrobiaceae bacterium]
MKYERLYLPREKDRRRLSESGGVFARPIRWDLIEQQYDEMVKAAVALKRDTATAEAILKRYNSYNLTHPTYKALAEVGKAEKEHLSLRVPTLAKVAISATQFAALMDGLELTRTRAKLWWRKKVEQAARNHC